MSLFEFVLAFSSVISALGLSHLLAGAVHILRRRKHVRFSLTHALWMWSILAMTMGIGPPIGSCVRSPSGRLGPCCG
ncbi:MAG: hypothetical protein ABL932_23125 [Terricaulis sp.]